MAGGPHEQDPGMLRSGDLEASPTRCSRRRAAWSSGRPRWRPTPASWCPEPGGRGVSACGSASGHSGRSTGAADPQRFTLLDESRRSLPDGFKAEISGDTIVMTVGGSSGIHQCNVLAVRRQFDAHSPSGLVPSENTDLVSPGVGKSRNPDLTYLPAEALETTDNQVPAEAAAIAVELVSPSNPENDWVGKVRDYPVMGIPLYLVVDARLKTVTLFSLPDSRKYHRREDADFGETLRIPEPFGFDLDTATLLPYSG